MLNDIFEQVENEIKDIPQEVGTEAVHQMKGDDKANQQKQQKQGDDHQDQNYLDELYGNSSLTPQQVKQKEEQDKKIIRQRYMQIQQDLQEFRAKKMQEVRKDEIGQQQGLDIARTQEDKKELWEEEQKKAEKKKKEEEAIRMPGSAQSRSGEQQKIMG